MKPDTQPTIQQSNRRNGTSRKTLKGNDGAKPLSTRDIRGQLERVYGLKVLADPIRRVTDAVLEEVSDWQHRALEPIYPIVKAVRSRTRLFTWPWASLPNANVRFWGYGLPIMKGPNSSSR